MVQNAQGVYLATQPVTDLDFPWDWGELPTNFTSSDWAHISDPVNNCKLPGFNEIQLPGSFLYHCLAQWLTESGQYCAHGSLLAHICMNRDLTLCMPY